MLKRMLWSMVLLLTGCFLVPPVQAQTLNGLMTGTITDPGGATVAGVEVTAVNLGTGETRKAVADNMGVWLIPQLPPATYKVTLAQHGFATIVQDNVQLDVNQSITLDFKLKVASSSETVQVSTAPPTLNTTSATLSTIVGHQEVVDLPLNGREFTQLALLSPGAAPVENAQQTVFAIPEGGGGISPSTNGQRGEENNFTLDGIENNELFDQAWAISPPPDAIEEFNVQSHMTDAQFAVSSGANINVQTRSGTNRFHGDVWEYIRNDAFDATQYPNTTRPFYHQNQYGFFVGGPVIRNRTFFSGYWEGYRFSQASVQFGNTLTADEIAGNFSQFVGTTPIGTDDLGRPTYANELYDATTSRPDPLNPALTIRDPFPAAPGGSPGSQIPSGYISPQALIYLKAFYPAPNLNVAPGVFPNFKYNGASTKKGDQFGARLDHRFRDRDSVFFRFAQNDIHATNPGSFPTYPGSIITNFADQYELGYTHLFDPNTILNIRAAYVKENLVANSGVTNDPSLTAAMGTQLVSVPRLGANVPIFGALGNGVTQVANIFNPLGPSSFYEFNVDGSKTVGNHTISGGGMFFDLRQVADVVIVEANASPAGTSVNGNTSGATGFGPASFLEGIVDQFYTYNLKKNLDLTVPWWAFYVQDLWKVNKNLVLSFGARWDYVAPGNYHRQALVFDPITGKMWGIGAPFTVPTAFLPVNDPHLYHANPGYFDAKKGGWEPRLGATYQAGRNTVAHFAFGIFDQHDNQLTQGNENIALNWPNGDFSNQVNLDSGVPKYYLNTLPTEASLLAEGNPSLGAGEAKNTPISYVMEYNAGIQHQIGQRLALNVDYVGSAGRHVWMNDTSNLAMYPGPGPQQARAQFPQYGPIASFNTEGVTSYNALQAMLRRPFSSGATFTASYTWSKSMDEQSDPYGDQGPYWYNPGKSWGPSEYDIRNLFVFSGVYQLPFGRGRMYMNTPNRFAQEILGDWQIASIVSLHSGLPEWVSAGGDIANTGESFQPAQRGRLSPYQRSGGGANGFKHWLRPPTTYAGTSLPDSSSYAFTQPLPFTYGNERRNDLVGPGFVNVDFSLQKNFPIWEAVNFQFRTEFFNIFNHTNYGGFSNNVQNPSQFGEIFGVTGNARIIQFSGKISF